MEIKDLIKLQKDFDSKHNWIPLEDNELLQFLNYDLIGLFGEVGEFANIIKKINLLNSSKTLQKNSMEINELLLESREEIIDCFIYILRMGEYLGVDFEKEYIKKMNKNKKKYQKFKTTKK